jgi:hypothetical protein
MGYCIGVLSFLVIELANNYGNEWYAFVQVAFDGTLGIEELLG